MLASKAVHRVGERATLHDRLGARMSCDIGSSAWSSPLLRGLPEDDLQALLDICRVTHVGRHTPLLRSDEDQVALIVRGSAKAHATTRAGDQVITALLGPGDAWGFGVVLGYRPAGTNVTSIEPLDALVMSGHDLRRLLVAHPPITGTCLRTVGRQLALAQSETLHFAGTSTDERVTQRVLDLATRWGEQQDGRLVVTLPITQDELAAWAASSRESTAKALHNLRRAGIVETGRRTLHILSIERLRDRCRARRSPSPGDLISARS
jgi:CRP/FNR family transcriptional regulator, cyclic AMP receptor protein